jgi:hypothetical protein
MVENIAESLALKFSQVPRICGRKEAVFFDERETLQFLTL